MSRIFAAALAGLAALSIAEAGAADLPADVLVQTDRVKITRADVDAELANVPAGRRTEFAASSERMSKLMNTLLETKTLAVEARAKGLDKDPEVQARIAAQTERILALARSDQIEREAEAAFDRRRDEFVGVAREYYLTEKDKYTTPEQVSVAHILVRTDRHSKEEALKLAQEVRAQVVAAGADFASLARKYSEDPSAKSNGGSIGWVVARQVDKAFWTGAMALQKQGDVSEPILTQFGYHIIRLDGKKAAELQPFEKVKDRALAEVKQNYVKAEKNKVSEAIFKDPSLQLNQPAIDALVTKMDAEAFRKPGAAAAAK
jgi:parvulin-like peptidyl-prolyl isomerase